MPDILNFTFEELEQKFWEMGEPKFRAKQVWQWIWNKLEWDIMAWTNTSLVFRQELLADNWGICGAEIEEVAVSADGTRKILLRLRDEALIETVLIPDEDRYTQCLSSQVGCVMACTFCATGQLGFTRNLTSGEILAQILLAKKYLHDLGGNQMPLKNLVFMGMGEPLLNWENVKQAIKELEYDWSACFSRRRCTLSTSGIPKIFAKFAESDLALPALSLHAPTQALREQLMPKASEYQLDDIIEFLSNYPLRPRERITIEYLLLGGVNDSLEHAKQLAKLLLPVKCKVNLIAYNPVQGISYIAPTMEQMRAFQMYLQDKGMTVILRKSKGQDIAAACGQLCLQRGS